jgi:hypothetical protein
MGIGSPWGLEPEDLRLRREGRVGGEVGVAEVLGELLAVTPGDRRDLGAVVRVQAITRQDRLSELGSGGLVAAHEPPAVLEDRLPPGLLDLGLSVVDHQEALAGELEVLGDLGLDRPLGHEGVEVACGAARLGRLGSGRGSGLGGEEGAEGVGAGGGRHGHLRKGRGSIRPGAGGRGARPGWPAPPGAAATPGYSGPVWVFILHPPTYTHM